MFEAYAIGVTLKLNNLVSPQLALMSEEFTKLEGLAVALNSALKGIGREAAGLRSIATAGNASNRALERAAASAAVLERRLVGIRAASGGGGGGLPVVPLPGTAPRVPGGAVRPPGGAGGRGGGGPGGGFHGGNIHMGPGGIGLGTVGMGAGAWFWPLAASGAAIYGGRALFDAAKELDTEQQRFRLLGMSAAQNAEAFRFARNTQNYGTTQIERLAAFREAQGVGRESGLAGSDALKFAELASPVLARLDALGVGLDDESKSSLHGSNIALLRFVEQSGGLKSAEEFKRIADLGFKLKQSSGGTIDYEQLRAATSMGGAYTQSMTGEGWAYAEPIMQEVKGSAYGVGKSTAGARLFNVMSKTPKNLIAEATRLGLWTPERQHLSEEDSALFKESWERFYIDRMMPLYEKFNLSPNDRVRDNSILFGRTGGRLANLVEKQIPQINASAAAYQKAKTIDQAGDQLKGSLSGQQLEFEAAWKDFKTQWGTTALPFFTGILKVGSSILRSLGAISPPSQQDHTGQHWNRGGLWTGGYWEDDLPASTMHSMYVTATSLAAKEPSPFIDSGKSKSERTAVINMMLDGRKVGQALLGPMAGSLSAPLGGANFDGSLSLAPVLLNQAH